jgi:hypothetical protein
MISRPCGAPQLTQPPATAIPGRAPPPLQQAARPPVCPAPLEAPRPQPQPPRVHQPRVELAEELRVGMHTEWLAGITSR